MATGILTRNTTLPDSSAKSDFHNLIDTATISISNIVNADVDSAAAIAASKLNLATIAQTIAMSSKAINEAQGSNIASASSIDIGAATGNYVVITGTTTITSLGTVQAGTRRILEFSGALTLTHNATSLILPSGASITTAAGDVAHFISEGSGNWRCVVYSKANGQAVVSTSAATQAEMEAASSTSVMVTPGRVQYHPGVAKAWAHFTCGSGTVSLDASYNVSSISDRGVGLFTANWTTAFSSANYSWAGSARDTASTTACGIGSSSTESDQSTTALPFVIMYWTGGSANDTPERVSVIAWGDQ